MDQSSFQDSTREPASSDAYEDVFRQFVQLPDSEQHSPTTVVDSSDVTSHDDSRHSLSSPYPQASTGHDRSGGIFGMGHQFDHTHSSPETPPRSPSISSTETIGPGPEGAESASRTLVLPPGRSLAHLAPKGMLAPKKAFEFIAYSTPTSLRQPGKARPRRRGMDAIELAQYRATRQAKACVRCSIRGLKCSPSGHCERCQKQNIPEELCCRDKVKDVELWGVTGLAKHFVESYAGSIRCWSDAPHNTLDVHLWHSYGPKFSLRVTRFETQRKIIDLGWKDPSGWQKLEHTPYGIRSDRTDIDANALDAYAHQSIPCILQRLEPSRLIEPRIDDRGVQESRDRSLTSKAWTLMMHAATALDERLHETGQKSLLRTVLIHWSLTFLQYHSLWTCTDQSLLGMEALAVKYLDVQTLTSFHGEVPLPRLLHQQIHACCEARQWMLGKRIAKELHTSINRIRIIDRMDHIERKRAILELYLSLWVYLSTLEEIVWDAGRWKNLSTDFSWPLEMTTDRNEQYCRHTSRVIIGHLKACLRNQTISQWIKTTCNDPESSKAGSEFDDICSTILESLAAAPNHVSGEFLRMPRAFQANDIRSLEYEFTQLLL